MCLFAFTKGNKWLDQHCLLLKLKNFQFLWKILKNFEKSYARLIQTFGYPIRQVKWQINIQLSFSSHKTLQTISKAYMTLFYLLQNVSNMNRFAWLTLIPIYISSMDFFHVEIFHHLIQSNQTEKFPMFWRIRNFKASTLF